MMAGFSKYSAAWKNVMEPITGTVVIYEADVVLSKAKKKHVPCGGISCYHKMYNVTDKVSHKPRSS